MGNKKRANADRPRDFVCFPQCTDWTKQKQNKNPDSFTGCRLHAPITNPINGWATCQKGKWVVEKPLKKCFCDLCDPADAQKQLRKKQRQGRHEDYGADFSKPTMPWTSMTDNKDFASHTHQQIIVGSCGPTCHYQPVGYQQGKDKAPILASRDPPTHWTFRTETGPGGDQISYSGEMYNFAELDCGTDQDIMEACGPKGLKTREKRHYFCANGQWISGADNHAVCNCEKNKKAKKSKDKHNKDKPKK